MRFVRNFMIVAADAKRLTANDAALYFHLSILLDVQSSITDDKAGTGFSNHGITLHDHESTVARGRHKPSKRGRYEQHNQGSRSRDRGAGAILFILS